MVLAAAVDELQFAWICADNLEKNTVPKRNGLGLNGIVATLFETAIE
jgi:hypothetical protein